MCIVYMDMTYSNEFKIYLLNWSQKKIKVTVIVNKEIEHYDFMRGDSGNWIQLNPQLDC